MTCCVILLIWTCNGGALLSSSPAWQSAANQDVLVLWTLTCLWVKHQVQATALCSVLDLSWSGVLQDDSCTWSPEQLQMAVGFPPEDFAEEASLAHAESADSPGQMRSTAMRSRSVSLAHPPTPSLTHPATHSLTLFLSKST